MADPVNAALRAELVAAREVLVPQIRGLEDLGHISLSDAAKAIIATELEDRRRRVDLIGKVISAIDGTDGAMEILEADGYPTMPPGEMPPEVAAEIEVQKADLVAAFAQLVAEPPPIASVATATFPEPTLKNP